MQHGILIAIAQFIALTIQGADPSPSGREVLEKLIDYRCALQTAKVELEIIDSSGAWQGAASDKSQFMSVLFAGDQQIRIRRGDSEGVVIRTPEGKPHPTMGHLPYFILDEPGRTYTRTDDPMDIVRARERTSRQRDDLRTLGMSSFPSSFDLPDTIWFDNVHAPAAPKLEQSRDGDLDMVRVTMSTKKRTYWLDPAKNGSPVRVREEDEQGDWRGSRSNLVLTDGVWFPRSVHFFSSRFKGGREPAQVVQVSAAEFNRPSHPARLTLTHIGVEVGMIVDSEGAAGKSAGRWDGEKIVGGVEFVQRLVAGELVVGARLVAAESAAYDKQLRACA